MSIESRLAVKIVLLALALAVAFAAGAYFARSNKTCITGEAQVGTVVICGELPAGAVETEL